MNNNLDEFINILKKSDLVFFDCDGTTYQSEHVWNEACIKALKELGVTAKLETTAQSTFGKNSQTISGESAQPVNEWAIFRSTPESHAGGKKLFMAFAKFIIGEYALKNITPIEFEQLMSKHSIQILNTVRHKDNAEKLLHTLKNKGKILAIVTMADDTRLNALLNNIHSTNAGINGIFDVIIHGDMLPESAKGKPDPICYLMAIDEAGRLRNKGAQQEVLGVAFEDTAGGVEAATRAHLITCAVPSGDGMLLNEKAAKLAYTSINNYHEIIEKLKDN